MKMNLNQKEDKNLDLSKQEIIKFAKSTLLALCGVFLVVVGFYYLPDTVATMSFSSDKKLPIYCVDTEEPKVALSFDAAWGNSMLMK